MSEPVCITEQIPAQSLSPTEIYAPEHRFRRFVSKAAICMGGLALGAGLGAAVGVSTETQTTIAGNEATAELHFGNNNIDLGIIGAHIPSKSSILGLPIGANVRLDASQSYSPGKTPDEKVLPELLQTFSDIKHETDKITSDINWHIARDTRNGAFGGLATVGGLMLLFGASRKAWNNMEKESREDFKSNFGPVWKNTKYAVGGMTATAMIAACGIAGTTYMDAQPSNSKIQSNPAFDGTSLQGSEIVGLAAPLVDSAVPLVQKYITENDNFYNEVNKNFNEASKYYVSTNTLPSGKNIAPIMLVADRHCNIGMDRVLSSAAKIYNAQIIASAGDDNFWGSFSFEKACTSGLAERVKSINVRLLTTIANHDPHDKEHSSYQRDITIVDGKQIVIDTDKGKVTFLSSQDPRRSEFGHEIEPSSPETQSSLVFKQGLELGKLACDSQAQTDILITHSVNAANAAVQNGCGKIGFTLSGHTHHRKMPENINGTYQYTEGSTGGAAPDQASIGPLGTDATFSILYFNTQTHTPESIVYFTVHADKTVEISSVTPLEDSNDNPTAQTQFPIINNG